MKDTISYLYDVNIISESKYCKKRIFKSNSTSYLYEEIDNDKAVLFIDQINKLSVHHNFLIYKFKRNIYSEVISLYKGKKFTLIDIGNDYEKEVDFNDMLSFYEVSSRLIINNISYKNNWAALWEDKINYMVNHFISNKVSNKNIEYIFYYFISIAESALEYIINLEKKFVNKYNASLTHRRIILPNTKFYFFNPMNFVIDLEVRDVGEYIKRLFYSQKEYENELIFYLKTRYIDKYLASLLYARIIYPSIFFDDYELSTIDINKYIDFKSYENFAKKIYDIISSYILIDSIDWLN